MPFGLQPVHIVVIVIVALVVFGPKRLPEIGRWLGKSISEFRQGTREMTETLREEVAKAQTDEHNQTIAKPAPTQSVPVNARLCSKCGSANPAEALFCNKCGNPLQV